MEVSAREVEARGQIHERAQAGGGGALEWIVVIAVGAAVAAASGVTVDWRLIRGLVMCPCSFCMRGDITYRWRERAGFPDGPQYRW